MFWKNRYSCHISWYIISKYWLYVLFMYYNIIFYSSFKILYTHKSIWFAWTFIFYALLTIMLTLPVHKKMPYSFSDKSSLDKLLNYLQIKNVSLLEYYKKWALMSLALYVLGESSTWWDRRRSRFFEEEYGYSCCSYLL